MIWLATALAVQIQGRDLPCPTGAGTIRVNDRLSEDSLGGWDSDFARHSSNGQWRTYVIATCTGDFYSVYGEDAQAPVPSSQTKPLTDALNAARATLADPKNPTLWERYGLAITTYSTLGRDPVFLAELAVEATWTVRDAAVGYIPGIQGPQGARAYLDAGWEELKKPLADADRKKILFNLARIAERGGWPTERDGYLASLSAMSLTAEEQAGIARFRTLTNEVAPVWQDRAITALSLAMKHKAEPATHIGVSYTLADTLRRRGQLKDALGLFLVIADDKNTPPQIRELAVWLGKDTAAKLTP